MATDSSPKPEAELTKGKSRKRHLRKGAAARAWRAIFADDDVVADVVERSGAGRVQSAASVRSAVRFGANLEAKSGAKSAAK
jgi:hypothetical protein